MNDNKRVSSSFKKETQTMSEYTQRMRESKEREEGQVTYQSRFDSKEAKNTHLQVD
jgi:hypothetical protein